MNELDLFTAAVAIADPSKRLALLDRECAGRPELRHRLEKLIEAHVRSNPLLDGPNGRNPQLTLAHESPSPLVGTIIAGRYKLLEEIGDGGMGTVWMAEQKEPVKRLVAVKLIKAGMDSKAVLARFEAERQALAMMDHPNIAKVHDAGTDDAGRPYFVMELVKGLPLTEYCDARKLSVNDRLDLFVQICSAVQHAHQKAVIHRDLKPTNVLVTEHDGKPVPKVIDFGLAKALHGTNTLTDRTLHTAYGTVVGTPLYMAPEQVGINALDVDTRTDIYALGVILYELLTGTTPLEKARFKETAWEEMKRLIREEEPAKPSTRLSSSASLPSLAASRQVDPLQLRRLIRGELDWIVMKALDKDRSRRYETANGLSRDVQRYLKGDAVEACPPTLGYRLRKLYRRNRGAALTAGAVAAALIVGLIATTYGLYRADRERQRAEGAEQNAIDNERHALASAEVARQRLDEVNAAHRKLEAEQDSRARSDYGWSIMTANAASQQYRFDTANTFLNRTKPELRGWEWHYLNRLCRGDELYTLRGKSETVMYGAYSPDGRQIAMLGTRTRDVSSLIQSIEIWDVVTRQSFTLYEGPAFIRVLQFSPDGQKLLVTQQDKVSLWDIPSRTETVLFVPDARTRFWDGRFSPDGKSIVTSGWWGNIGTDAIETLAVWNVVTRERVWSQKRPNEVCSRISYSGDSRWILGTFNIRLPEDASQRQRVIRICDAETGVDLLEIANGSLGLWGAALSPDGSRLAVSGYEAGPKVWRVRRAGNRPVLDGEPIVLRGHAGIVGTPAFSPDGSLLATTADDRTVRIWDAATGAELRVLAGHSGWVSSIRFSPDSQRVLTTSGDGTARVWDAHRADPQVVFRDSRRLFGMDLSPAGDRMLVYDLRRTWGVYDLQARRLLPVTIPGSPARFSPDGKRIATLVESADRTADKIGVYDVDTGRLIREYQRKLGLGARFTFSADGSRILIPGDSRRVMVWEIDTGRTWELGESGKPGFAGAEFSPDGSRIFLDRSGDDPTHQVGITMLDGETYKPLVNLETTPVKYSNWYRSFSQDGRKFLAYYIFPDSSPNECRIWDATTGRLLRTFRFPAEFRGFVQLSPDGSRIFIADWDGRLRMVDADTGDELLALQFPALQSVTFDRSGHKMIVASTNEVRILDGTPLPESKK